MSSVSFNWLPQPSAYNQLQTQRLQRKADIADQSDFSASVAGSFNDAMANQYSGVANLAAQAAAKRLGITLPSQANSATTNTSSQAATPPTPAVDHVADMNNYIKTLNQILNGTAAITSQTQSAIASAGTAQAAIANILDGANIGNAPSATVGQIIDGTAKLVSSAQSKMSSDGNMFSTIDRIINSAVPTSSVKVTA